MLQNLDLNAFCNAKLGGIVIAQTEELDDSESLETNFCNLGDWDRATNGVAKGVIEKITPVD
ncbi:MAG: hypothetical protein LUC43_06840 [Burkholderiales bacterium]|nr:hypothetical protein [Burkholderiales bacterium]